MKIKVLKNILLPVGAVVGSRRFVIGAVIEVKDKLEDYVGWIGEKIAEGIFEEVKEVKSEVVETVAESIVEAIEEKEVAVEVKTKRKYNRKKK